MSDKRNRGAGIDRRSFIGSSVAAAGLLAGGALRRAWAQDIRLAAQSKAVQTTSGSIQGIVLDGGVNAFYGVPYGASTAGANRFLPPQKPTPWSGVKETTVVGYRSPQGAGPISEVAALDRQEPMSEDCLNLNVFTPALGRGDRPVMLWLHGGGFTSGSGNWLLYDGARLARSQDVVVVPVTHRLNVFGYLYLEDLGEEQFKGASNVGMLDIIAALQWVRDNISQFGGNPGNVTIFGQSGGGGKVGALLGMTPAKGLFHKAIGMSGALIQGVPKYRATETALKFMAAVGAKTVADLQKLPTEQLRTAFINTQGLALQPVVDGHTLPADPFAPAASPLSAGIPLMMGTTEHEVNFFPNTPVDPIDDADLFTRVKQSVRADDAKTKEVIELYRHNRPKASNVELYQIIASDNFRAGPLTQTERKAEQASAPVYQYYFRWSSVVRDGKLRAFHTLDIPFAFNNVEVATSMTGTAQSRYALATKVSSAFASFARTSNPNTGGLPNWPQFDMKTRATMAFNNDCEVLNDPYRNERLLLAQLRDAGARNG